MRVVMSGKPATSASRVDVYQRKDKRWAWRLVVNGRVIAGDMSQGYENRAECVSMAVRILGGEFRAAAAGLA
jgi:uncharacterized protein YegP (UPF0339 family)